MYIPEDKVSEILNVTDIVQIISESVILKKSGLNYFGLCPFHSEKTPSFSVNPQKQIFHCFGCNSGGNVFSYIMKYQGISFPEAVKMLARKHNILIEMDKISPSRQKEFDLKDRLFKINKQVMTFYHQNLLNEPSSAPARDYLIKRGLSDDLIRELMIGYSPDRWDAAAGLLGKLKVARQLSLTSGLVLPRKQTTGVYDRFRNRIMFPIFDINQQVAGFGGRVMDDAMPKYLNSPETPVYNKSKILYGLHVAKIHCRQKDNVYIVEGYFDFLSLYQHGIKNCVASLGTALTSDHVRILKGYASKMTLVFDSDTAGISAAKRSISIFMKEGVDVRVLVLPEGNDPDSFVSENGGETFEKFGETALTVIQFLTRVAISKFGLSVEGRINVLNDMKLYLSQIEDSAVRSLYIKDLAEKLNIDEKAVLEKVREVLQNQKTGRQETSDLQIDKDQAVSNPREEQIISLMLQYPGVIDVIINTNVLDYFYSERLKQIGKLIIQMKDTDGSFIPKVMSRLSGPDRTLVAALVIEETLDENDISIKATDLISRIIKIRKKDENTLTNKIISAEKGSDSNLFELLKKKQLENVQLHLSKQH